MAPAPEQIPALSVDDALGAAYTLNPTGEVNLWQGCHELAEKSSKIVSLGAPFFIVTYVSGRSIFHTFKDEVKRSPETCRSAAQAWGAVTFRPSWAAFFPINSICCWRFLRS
jgi:hypothetical protein